MAVAPPREFPSQFETAVRLLEDMRRRGKQPSDLNERGQAVLREFQGYLQSQGFSSYRDFIGQLSQIEPRQLAQRPQPTPSSTENPFFTRRGQPDPQPVREFARRFFIGADGEPAILPRALGEAYFAGGVTAPATIGAGALAFLRGLRGAQQATQQAPQVARQARPVLQLPARAGPAGTGSPGIPMPAPRTPLPSLPPEARFVGQPGGGLERAPVALLPEPAPPIRGRPQAPPRVNVFSRQEARPLNDLPVTAERPVDLPRIPAGDVPPVSATPPAQKVSEFRNSVSILDRVLGRGVGSKLEQAEQISAEIAGRNMPGLRNAGILNLTPAEDANLFRALEGRAQPLTPRVRTLYDEFIRIRAEDAQDLTVRGAQVLDDAVYDTRTGSVLREPRWRPFHPVANYAPRFPDFRKFARATEEQIAAAFKRANPELSDDAAQQIAQGFKAQATGQPLPVMADEVRRVVRGAREVPTHLHARQTVRIPDEFTLPMREALPRYVRSMAKERGVLQVYGPADGLVEDALKSASATGHPDLHIAQMAWDRYRGRYIPGLDLPRTVDQVVRILGSIASGTLLGVGTAVSQISQLAPVFARTRLPNFARGLLVGFTRAGKVEAGRFGTYVDDLYREVTQASELLPTATVMDRIEQATSRFAGGAIRLSGVNLMDQMGRVTGFHALKFDFTQLRNAAALGNRKAVEALARVGLKPTSSAEEIARKAADLSGKLNVRARTIDLPFILTLPGWRAARQLNSFTIEFSKVVMREFVQPAVRGNPGPLLKLLGAGIVTGEAIADIRRWMQGREAHRPGGTAYEFFTDLLAGRVPPIIVVNRFADNLTWAGIFGIAQNIKEAVAFRPSPFEAPGRVISQAAGAGVGNILELGLGAPLAAGQAITAKTPEQRTARLRTAARIVARRTPIVGTAAMRVLPSEFVDRQQAIGRVVRALRRGDQQEATRWLRWFQQRHGNTISQEALDNAIRSGKY